jgi:monoamine oxidase
MTRTLFNRRAVLAASAGVFAAGTARADDADVIVIGAGSAGIGAARELKRLGKRVLLIEARERAGGRVFTDTSLGQPFEAGAAYIHFAENNPWNALAQEAGVDPQGGYRLWSGSVAYRDGVPMSAPEGAARWQAMRRVAEIYEDVEDRSDVSMADAWKAEPQDVKDAGRIQAQMAAGEDPEWVSVADWNRLESGGNRLVPGGYGTLVARTAGPLEPRYGVRVTSIDWSGQSVKVSTDKGDLRARKVICTVPVGVLKSGSIQFKPGLPTDHVRALDGMRMGALSKVALRFEGERFGFAPHQFLADVGEPARAMTFEAWPQDTGLIVATFGGDYARSLSKGTAVAAVEQALERFIKIAGSDARKAYRGGAFANWAADPFSQGAYAVVRPGRMRAREYLARPIADKLWFAGEATAGIYSMTAGGAYIAGRDAAKSVAAKLSTGSIR